MAKGTRESDDKVFFIENEPHFMLLDDFHDWFVSTKDAKKFRRLWRKNVPFAVMCRRLDMDGDTLLILIVDQSRKGLIQPRKIGIGL